MLFSAATTFDPTSQSSVNAARAKLALPPLNASDYFAWLQHYEKTLTLSLHDLDVSAPASACSPEVCSSRPHPSRRRSVSRRSARIHALCV